jgi:ACS family glucarate transporter-like MFS transporter
MVRGGWRLSFWVCAILGLIAGGIWFVLARQTPQEHPWVSASELNKIRAGLTGDQSRKAEPLPWRRIFTSKEVLIITYSYFCYGYSAYMFFTWFFIYLSTVRGLNLRESSYYSMAPFLAMAVGSPLGGVLSDFLTRRRSKRLGRCGIGVFGIGLAAVFIALGSTVASPRLASLVLASGAGALYLSQSSFWSVTADIAGKSAGSVSGVMNMGGQFGGAVTASLTPLIATHFGWSASFLVAALLCATGSVAWLFVDPTRELAPKSPAVS